MLPSELVSLVLALEELDRPRAAARKAGAIQARDERAKTVVAKSPADVTRRRGQVHPAPATPVAPIAGQPRTSAV
jgi:hypothetical protein